MNSPFISIIVPIFNQEYYCQETIDSFLNQGYKNIELILVNDGSTDSSLEIIMKKAREDSRVLIIDQTNLGPSAAINSGLKIATGEFIVLCGGDDVYLPNSLQKQVDLISNSTYDLLFSLPILIDAMGKRMEDSIFPIFFRPPHKFNEKQFRSLFFNGNFLCGPTVIFRKSVIADVGFFNEEIIQLQDYEFWMRALGKGKKLFLSDIRTILYRRHPSNLSANKKYDLLNAEYYFLLPRILELANPEIVRESFEDILPISIDNQALANFEKAAILMASPLMHSRYAGVALLYSLNENEKQYLKDRGINLFKLIYNYFSTQGEDPLLIDNFNLRNELGAILKTKSWRYTRPLRALLKFVNGDLTLKKIFKVKN
jgi:glycosyltransferase involved in cell wall biosynthesis